MMYTIVYHILQIQINGMCAIDKVNIIDKIPNISLPNCMLLFNEPNREHKKMH